MKKLAFLTVFLLVFFSLKEAQSLQCYNIFNNREITITAPYSQIYAGQTMVGMQYALYKELRDLKIPPRLTINELSKSQKKALHREILKELKEGTPAVRDPSGRIFLLDGHHSIFVATLLFPEIQEMPIKLNLAYDGTLTGISWDTFVRMALEQKWFYEPTAREILENPRQVHELTDSVERSMLGLVFLSVEETYNVPMKGKYFYPFIQFYLADLIRNLHIYEFPDGVDFNEVLVLQKKLLTNKEVNDFFVSQLRPKTSKKLLKFFENKSF